MSYTKLEFLQYLLLKLIQIRELWDIKAIKDEKISTENLKMSIGRLLPLSNNALKLFLQQQLYNNFCLLSTKAEILMELTIFFDNLK